MHKPKLVRKIVNEVETLMLADESGVPFSGQVKVQIVQEASSFPKLVVEFDLFGDEHGPDLEIVDANG